jgi:hypothetical protein
MRAGAILYESIYEGAAVDQSGGGCVEGRGRNQERGRRREQK